MDSVIKKNLLKTVLFFTCIILTTFSLFLSIFIYQIKINDVTQIVKEKNEIITLSIENLFFKIRNYIELLSDDGRVANLVSSPADRRDVLLMYKKLQDIDHDIAYIYSAYEDGSLVINGYTPPAGFDPRVRPWYKAALKADPGLSTGIPYREIKTHNWLVSFSKTLRDASGVRGVLAIDVSLAGVINRLKNRDTVDCLILNKRGQVIIHNNPSLLNKLYSNSTLDSKNKLIYSQPIKNLGWTVITEVDKSKIFSPIIYQILICNLIVLMITFTIGWGLSFSFNKKFVHPIVKLKERVESIIDDDLSVEDKFKYPQNEIGIIAEKIESLTQQELYRKNRQLKELSQIDQLTKLYNRRHILQLLNDELERAKRYRTIFSLFLFDVDFFKQINDRFGHNTGDDVLKQIAELSTAVVRRIDKVGRWGGEEFLILCPETNGENAVLLAEKLRVAVQGHNFGIGEQVTISGGVVEYDGEDNIVELIGKADEKLYRAKHQGRNRILV